MAQEPVDVALVRLQPQVHLLRHATRLLVPIQLRGWRRGQCSGCASQTHTMTQKVMLFSTPSMRKAGPTGPSLLLTLLLAPTQPYRHGSRVLARRLRIVNVYRSPSQSTTSLAQARLLRQFCPRLLPMLHRQLVWPWMLLGGGFLKSM